MADNAPGDEKKAAPPSRVKSQGIRPATTSPSTVRAAVSQGYYKPPTTNPSALMFKPRYQPRPKTSHHKKVIDKSCNRATRTDDPYNYYRTYSYDQHRKRVENVKAIVDSSCPIAAKNLYSQPTAFNRRLANFSRIERQNAILLRRIAQILEGDGMIDNRHRPDVRNTNNRGRARQANLLKVTFGNLALLKRIQDTKPMYSRQAQLDEYAKYEKIMSQMSIYPLFWKVKPVKGWEKHEQRAVANAARNPFPRCYLQLGTDTKSFGRVIIQLHAQKVPMTCENFRCLCTGETGLSYKCSNIHRIIPGILWQGGDITGHDGLGNKSIYGENFADENFRLKHNKSGTVSMANCGPNTNGSQFIITARETCALDNCNVVFGKVIGGMAILKKLFKMIGATGKPKSTIWIVDCGELDPDDDISDELDKDKSPTDDGEYDNEAYEEETEAESEPPSAKENIKPPPPTEE